MEKIFVFYVFVLLVLCHTCINGDDTNLAKNYLYRGVPYVIRQSKSVDLPDTNVVNSRNNGKDFSYFDTESSQNDHKLPRNDVPELLSKNIDSSAVQSSNRAYEPDTELWSRQPQLQQNNLFTPDYYMNYNGQEKGVAQSLYPWSDCEDGGPDNQVPNNADKQPVDTMSTYRSGRRVQQPLQSLKTSRRKPQSQSSYLYPEQQFGNSYGYPYYPYFGYYYYPMAYFRSRPFSRHSSRTSPASSGISTIPSSKTSFTPFSKLSSSNFHSNSKSATEDLQRRKQQQSQQQYNNPTLLSSNVPSSLKCDCTLPECQNCENVSSSNCSCCCKKDMLTLHVHLLHLKPQTKNDIYANLDDSVRRSLRTISGFDTNKNLVAQENIAGNNEGETSELGIEELIEREPVENLENVTDSSNSTRSFELSPDLKGYDRRKKKSSRNIQFNNFIFYIFPNTELFKKGTGKFRNNNEYQVSNDESENLTIKERLFTNSSLSPSVIDDLLASLNFTAVENFLNSSFSNRGLLDDKQWSKVDEVLSQKKSSWGHQIE